MHKRRKNDHLPKFKWEVLFKFGLFGSEWRLMRKVKGEEA